MSLLRVSSRTKLILISKRASEGKGCQNKTLLGVGHVSGPSTEDRHEDHVSGGTPAMKKSRKPLGTGRSLTE